MKILKQKYYKITQNVLTVTGKEYDLLQDRPVLSTGKTPHDKQNRNCLEYNQNLVMSPRGAQRQDRLTDPHLQSNSDFDCLGYIGSG
jgi:hypothetical protein